MQPSILVIDDEPDNFDVIQAFLTGQDVQLHYAASGINAITALETFQPSLILLDVMMPGINGMEVCRQIKALPEWEAVPIIMVTSLDSTQDLADCLDAGADDFISKPIQRLELRARVDSMLRIWQQYQKLANFNAQLERAVQQRTAKLNQMVYQDGLTHLPSRVALVEAVNLALADGQLMAVVAIDCDAFDLLKGSFGQMVCDQLLIAIAERLKKLVPPSSMIARVGDDEFCILLHQLNDVKTLESFITGILRSFEPAFSVNNCDIFVTVCIGVALVDSTYQQAESILQDAYTANYHAKLKGKGCFQIFDRNMRQAMIERLTLENDLQRALEQEEFVLHYQPIVNLHTLQVIGFEALVRWRHPERGMISPGVFIPCMETTGLIIPVGILVLRYACQQLADWQKLGWTDITMSVNLSVRQFTSSNLVQDVDRVLTETSIDPAHLRLEITESAIMDNADVAIALTEELRSRHIKISIDDFGTGYSSLGYLHRFPVDTLKIDRTFVNQIQPASRKYHVVDTVVALGNQLGLSIIAEGIETSQQLEWLQQLGCEAGQGYFFAKPMAPDTIQERFMNATQPGTDLWVKMNA